MDLNIDQYEAILLADFMGVTQKEAANSMHISQQTFSRIIKKARKVMAEAIVRGKIIKIQGGSYVFSHRQEIPVNRPTSTAITSPKVT